MGEAAHTANAGVRVCERQRARGHETHGSGWFEVVAGRWSNGIAFAHNLGLQTPRRPPKKKDSLPGERSCVILPAPMSSVAIAAGGGTRVGLGKGP